MALDLAAGRGTERLRLERLRPECAGCGLTGPAGQELQLVELGLSFLECLLLTHLCQF